ncbi:hypothetical protein GCM10010460_19690 [Microbacterium terrae]|uniref:DNA modification methylase n=1 Tax=Microbacterium terrae TaxID=69369 RepID=A0A0M2HBN1_9MICO|nr:hypothetical protein RS81_01229 [Microbacterium terrae]GLJ97494.1 hypothetical protein GCM10017594_06910 [Microbacterium terrae]
MKPRLIASLAVCAALALATTGCSMISPQATTIAYSAADGVNVPDSGPVQVRNAFIVATEDGAQGNLIAAFVNDTDSSETVTIEVGDSGADTITVRIPARTTVSLGADEPPILIEALDTLPGADTPGHFQSGDAEGSLASLPVLDGSLPYLTDLVPEAAVAE